MSGDGSDTWDPTQYEFDQNPSELLFEVEESEKERVAVIRTSDRITFRRCRRRWGWSSHLRGNLGSREGQSPLWMGSGFHFALEDYHGKNLFGHPAKAFDEYVAATRRHDSTSLPFDWQELHVLANGMLSYYVEQWLPHRDFYRTYIHNGEPQVEVNFRVDIPFDNPQKFGYDKVVYSGTLDRVVEDLYGQLWIVEYKTAKTIQTLHLANDSQVSSYCWAGQLLYGRPIAGVIYQQHLKRLPSNPKVLGNGSLSLDKNQYITRGSLHKYLTNAYGSINKAPGQYVDLLNYFARLETPEADKFIRRSPITRNEHQCQAEGVKILMEVEEMLNPDLPLYPNPDRTCQFMCPFVGPCVTLDDGGDWEHELHLLTKERDAKYDTWRQKIQWPGEYIPAFTDQLQLPSPSKPDEENKDNG